MEAISPTQRLWHGPARRSGSRSRYYPLLASLGIALLGLPGAQRASAAPPTPARVRFQLRSECTCAACGFALQSQLRKLPGVTRVDLSARDRVVTIAYDEARLPLPRLAAAVAGTELGKRSALIGDLVDARAEPNLALLARIPGVRAVEAPAKKGTLLIEIGEKAPPTAAELSAAAATAGVAVRFERAAAKE